MADKKQQSSNGHQGFYMALTMVLIFLCIWAFAPEKLFETTWETEQHEILNAGGAKTNDWILSQSLHATEGLNSLAADMTGDLGGKGMPDSTYKWMLERVAVSIVWANMVVYRGFILVMWILLGLPLVIATAIDAYYAREIAKERFSAQSPSRHKVGVKVFHLSHIVLLVWIISPVHLPFLVIPFFTLLIAVSMWMWISNLQKRL